MRFKTRLAGITRRADGWGGLRSASNRSKGAGQLAMIQIGLMGMGAGAAAALLFASVTSGSYLSIVLFYLAPLADHDRRPRLEPLVGANRRGRGQSHCCSRAFRRFPFARLPRRGRRAGLVAAAACDAGACPPAGADSAPSDRSVEWFPPGALVVCAALLGAMLVLSRISISRPRRAKASVA